MTKNQVDFNTNTIALKTDLVNGSVEQFQNSELFLSERKRMKVGYGLLPIGMILFAAGAPLTFADKVMVLGAPLESFGWTMVFISLFAGMTSVTNILSLIISRRSKTLETFFAKNAAALQAYSKEQIGVGFEPVWAETILVTIRDSAGRKNHFPATYPTEDGGKCLISLDKESQKITLKKTFTPSGKQELAEAKIIEALEQELPGDAGKIFNELKASIHTLSRLKVAPENSAAITRIKEEATEAIELYSQLADLKEYSDSEPNPIEGTLLLLNQEVQDVIESESDLVLVKIQNQHNYINSRRK